uniref:Uncharacterized protein n=1 Tax=Timema cristinae TaxID=61476 RepID=A0A7R9D637_TIMCR|nr:unnamed protein product [Timema cristinae]
MIFIPLVTPRSSAAVNQNTSGISLLVFGSQRCGVGAGGACRNEVGGSWGVEVAWQVAVGIELMEAMSDVHGIQLTSSPQAISSRSPLHVFPATHQVTGHTLLRTLWATLMNWKQELDLREMFESGQGAQLKGSPEVLTGVVLLEGLEIEAHSGIPMSCRAHINHPALILLLDTLSASIMNLNIYKMLVKPPDHMAPGATPFLSATLGLTNCHCLVVGILQCRLDVRLINCAVLYKTINFVSLPPYDHQQVVSPNSQPECLGVNHNPPSHATLH